MNKIRRQTSDTVRLGIILALSGGFMDAYSYLFRGHVFANAQTGNILLFGVNMASGNFTVALRYFCPIIAFTLGIFLADFTRYKAGGSRGVHWRQLSVLIEAIILLGVAFIPTDLNLLANSLTSFACGIQVQSFRKIHGNGIATTMCIGNLRSGTQNLFDYIVKKDKKYLSKCCLYFGIIICFTIGAVIGSEVIIALNEKAILVCSFVLFAAFGVMFVEEM